MPPSKGKGAALAAAALACLLPGSGAYPAGLQVSPVSLTIEARSGVLWLSNMSTDPLHAQIRVYRWSQQDGGDHEDATADLLASPPFVEIAPNVRQVVRIVRTGGGTSSGTSSGAGPCEQAFRLTVDELPGPPNEKERQSRIRYRLSYSVPIFVVRPDCRNETPLLTWGLERVAAGARLVVRNGGRRHARLSELVLVDGAGRRTEVNTGLVGYVLPGSRMAFALPPMGGPGSGAIIQRGMQFEVMVNGTKVTQALSPAAPGQ